MHPASYMYVWINALQPQTQYLYFSWYKSYFHTTLFVENTIDVLFQPEKQRNCTSDKSTFLKKIISPVSVLVYKWDSRTWQCVYPKITRKS